MTDLVEVVARAMHTRVGRSHPYDHENSFLEREHMERAAQAAIAAINASGTHVVVPVEPCFEVKMAGAEAITLDHMEKRANYDAACDCWQAMIRAAHTPSE